MQHVLILRCMYVYMHVCIYACMYICTYLCQSRLGPGWALPHYAGFIISIIGNF